MPSLGSGLISHTKDNPGRLGEGGFMVVCNLFIRNIERGISYRHFDCKVTCLPGSKVADIILSLDGLIDSSGEGSAVIVYVSTDDIWQCCHKVLEGKL